MALFAITSNLSKAVVTPVRPVLNNQLVNVFPVLSCSISGKTYREIKPRKAPYDYKNKYYPLWKSMLFDNTTDRFDENTKVIAIEGNIAAGKTKFAKELAEELDMYHMEEVTMDKRYINPYGFDLREWNHKLPEGVKCFDEKTFCKDPFHASSAAFQMWMYQLRYATYVDALAHVLSTGQGVVIERTPWSDMVFMEAMVKNKFMSKEARFVYKEVKRSTIHQLMRPHLVIYLDLPVSKVKENIKKRSLPHEQNSKALTDAYLRDIEDNYKTQYLKEISEHAELLMYDWSEGGDIEAIVEDIERIDFDKYTKHDKKMIDWQKSKENVWAEFRRLYADEKHLLMAMFNVPVFDAPELIASGEDVRVFQEVWDSAPGNEYQTGFNPLKGDSGLMFKLRGSKYVPF